MGIVSVAIMAIWWQSYGCNIDTKWSEYTITIWPIMVNGSRYDSSNDHTSMDNRE